MSREHWFDRISKLLTQDAPRRDVVGALTALALGHGLSADDAAGKNKGKGGNNGGKGGKNGKGHGKGNEKKKGNGNRNNDRKGNGGKDKPKPNVPPAGPDNCDINWPGEENQEVQKAWCRRTRDETCPQAGLAFCIVEGDPNDPAVVARCCDQGGSCCGSACCGGWRHPHNKCCGGICTNTEDDPDNCGNCGHHCELGQVCRGGSCGCEDSNCGGCGDGPPCGDGNTCCGGTCVNLQSHKNHCSVCSNPCSFWETCYEGVCRICPPGQKMCPSNGNPNFTCVAETTECCPTGLTATAACCPTGLTECGGECVDTSSDPQHCGGCNAFNPNGLACCNGNVCTYINGVCCGGTCYPEGWTCP
jgi:hypothetical protein